MTPARRGRPPVTGRYAADAETFRGISYPPEQAELIRLAAEGAGETPAAYIMRTALEAARRDLGAKR